jgi:uncharacterized membrane protein YtjA (UPF0391 family)
MNRIKSPWLYWAIVFLIIAIVAAVLGFGLVAGITFIVAKWLALIFVVLFLVALIQHSNRK